MPNETIDVKGIKEALEVAQSQEFYWAIGRFIFSFSQLEHQIKLTLASYLRLTDEQFDVIVGPYDFAMLCSVAEKTVRSDFDEEHHPKIKSFFNRCRKLNQEVRVIVAHGRWSSGGARYASRQTLEAKIHFREPRELLKAAHEAEKLIVEFSQMGAIANS